MAERASYDLQQLQHEAQHRWMRPAEICEILRNCRMFQITPEPPTRPPSGSLFLFDRKVLRYFRKDGHNWRKKRDGKTVKETYEKLKVGSVDVLHCYCAHGEENENFQRRSYWLLELDMMHIGFVHYLEVKGNKTNIVGNADSEEVTSGNSRSPSSSSGFPINYGNMPSRSTGANNRTSTLTSLCEDADSGDHGQPSVSGTNYIPLVQGDRTRGSNVPFVDGQNVHGMASWDSVLDQSTAGLHTDPPHKAGRFPFYVTCSNRLACSEVREFDFREGFTKDVEVEEIYRSSFEMFYLQLEALLSSKSVHPSNDKPLGSDTEKINLIYKLVSLKEEEDYLNKEETTLDMDTSQQEVKEQQFHRQVKEKLYSWLFDKVAEDGKGPNVLDEEGQGVLHLTAALGYDWTIAPIISSGVNINFRDINGWTALHWAASCGKERTVALLVTMGANPGALTDSSPAFPWGRTPADLASSNGHKGISGFLAECSLTDHLASLTMDEQKGDGGQEASGMKAVLTVSERSATPLVCGDMPDALCLKDSFTAVRNATQAADRIHQVFRMQSFQRKQLAEYEDDEFGLSDPRALSLLGSKAGKAGQRDGLAAHAAATQIQKKFHGWKKRKEFLILRQRIVKIPAHVRGHPLRKQYKSIIWSVGILEKVILRWRRKGSGLRGFRPDAAANKEPSQPSELLKEDDYDFLKEGRKQSEVRVQEALSRVKSMVQYPEARAQYRQLLNIVKDFRQTKAGNMDLANSEETVDGVEQLIDIDMHLDDNFIHIAFD